MELFQIRTVSFIAKCDGQFDKLRKLEFITRATRFVSDCDRYYKVAIMIIRTMIATVHALKHISNHLDYLTIDELDKCVHEILFSNPP